MNTYERGSEWRKWDLHVHTPKSIIQSFGGDTDEVWENYITDLESLPSNVKVIGVNDYIFIDGYRKILEYKAQGRLTNIDLFLPVIELRIDKFATLGDEAWKKVNLHIIFSDKLEPDIIEAQFLSAIQHSFKVSPDVEGIDFKGVATKSAIEDLGKKIKESAGDKTIPGSDLKVGFANLSFEYKAVKDALGSTYFKDKYLTAVGKSEWDTMRWDGSAATKKTIINEASFVFVALEKPEHHQKHFDALTSQKVNNRILDCSDAHDFSDSSEKDKIGNFNTWLKADATFEGLKQVANDSSRIFIGIEPDLLQRVRNNPTKYIKSLRINKISSSTFDEKWFQSFNLNLNSSLVAVIGNKGNGKSAIADTLGLIGNTQHYSDFSFLTGSKFRKRKPINKSEHFDGTIEWEDGNTDSRKLSIDPATSDVEKVKYIPQGFLEKLCNDDSKEFENEIRNVIFSHISESDRLGQTSLDDIITYKTEIVNKEIEGLKTELSTINTDIISLEEKESPEYKQQIEQRLKEKENELAAHLLTKPENVSPPQATLVSDEYKKISEEISEKRIKLEEIKKNITTNKAQENSLKVQIAEIEKTLQEITLFEGQYNKLREDISSRLTEENLVFTDIVTLKINTEPLSTKLITQRASLREVLNSLDKNFPGSLLLKKSKCEAEIKERQDKLDEPTKIYQRHIDTLKGWDERKVSIEGSTDKEGSLNYLKAILVYLNDGLKADLEKKLVARNIVVTKLFSKKNEILSLYRSLFKPITDFISTYGSEMDSYKIQLDVDYKFTGFVEKFFDHISLGAKGTFIGNPAGYEKLNHILDSHVLTTQDGAINFTKEIIQKVKLDYRNEDEPEPRNVNSQLKKGYNVHDFYSFIFGLDYLEPIYKLKLGEKDISELSPGERGALLLIFYLTLDQDDIPLVIDQPEENLDNQSVFKILVHFIKKAKERRQIIIVTHNPNLAVVCGAEQIVFVQIDKHDKNALTFYSGSLENSILNNAALDILEGTFPALNTRNATYDIIERP